MKRMFLTLAAMTALAALTTFAYGSPLNHLGYATESSWKMTHDIGKMLGAYVTDRDGNKIAKVKDFVMNEEGKIVFAVLGYSGAGTEERVAVPYSILFYNDTNKEFITSITKEQLASAPKVQDTADLGGHLFAGEVYRYFGVQPPWGNPEPDAGMPD